MKVICERESFYQALSTVQKAINAQNTLPILGNILLQAEGQSLFLTATNLEIAIKTSIPAQVKNEGGITVPARLIVNYVSFLKSGEIDVFVENGESLCINSAGSKTKIKGMNAEDYPTLPTVEKEFSLQISNEDLKSAIEQTVFSCSHSTTRPVLSGELFWAEGKELKLVATDSYRLGEKKIPLSEGVGSYKCIIPARTLQELSRVVSVDEKGYTKITASKNQILFQVGATQVSSRLIEGNFPDYQRIIPVEKMNTCEINRSELILGIKRVGIFARENNDNLKISLGEGKIIVTTDNTEIGNDVSEIEALVNGVGEVALNAQYLLDILQNIDDDTVFIAINERLLPVIIKPKSSDDFIHIIMPLKG